MSSTHPPSSHRPHPKVPSYRSFHPEQEEETISHDFQHHDTSGLPSLTSNTRSSYFDAYPKAKQAATARSTKSKYRSLSRSNSTATEGHLPSRQDPWESGPSKSPESSYTFPSIDPEANVTPYSPHPPATSPYTRTRSRTGPSARSNWEDPTPSTFVPHLRFSGSSSTQNTETPPRTPVDVFASNEFFEPFSVLVAAPVAGVEAMDALVDGMNGGDDLGISSRGRFGLSSHHPLYMPPLPTPPPGIVLGGPKVRRPKPKPRSSRSHSSESASDDDEECQSGSMSSTRACKRRPPRALSRTTSVSSFTVAPSISLSHAIDKPPTPTPSHYCEFTPRKVTPPTERRKSVVPSISEIIRTYASPENPLKRPGIVNRASSVYAPNQSNATVVEEPGSGPLPNDEDQFLSRSSIDSVADEVQRTIRNQNAIKPAPGVPSSFSNRLSLLSDNASIYSPRSDPGPTPSIHSSSAASIHRSYYPLEPPSVFSVLQPSSPSQAVAQYLRSARLTTLLKLTRSPHASQDHPLTVSLSDLGSPTGFPVVVFLGLGCVRHIMGLYDEMAECLGIRLITIDRWGLGRTDSRSKSMRGIIQWASVVEEVLHLLGIDKCGIMAHSAGAPYALSFANKVPHRVVGDICLLAPWVGGGEGGYKWLKFVPNGILKTAQAAEWRIQAWMIGKPPTISYQGIGYTPQTNKPSPKRPVTSPPTLPPLPPPPPPKCNAVYSSRTADKKAASRPSIGSSSFSEYDDLGDFDGRFESRSTLGASSEKQSVIKRKSSRGFLGRLKGSSANQASDEKGTAGKKLKALRSMGSLKGKSLSKKSEPPSPRVPPPLNFEVGLGFSDTNEPNELKWNALSSTTATTPKTITTNMNGAPEHGYDNPLGAITTYSEGRDRSAENISTRSGGQGSISFTTSKSTLSLPPSPAAGTIRDSFISGIGGGGGGGGSLRSNGSTSVLGGGIDSTSPGSAYQHAVGNALIAASHAESAKGTHSDFLQILNHENHSWGFSYSSYPHKVRIWYGDKDEKIAENAVRWMERNMGEMRCHVKVVKGADHALMYRSGVVVEVLETLLHAWKTGR